MKDLFKYGLVLGVICAIATGLLAGMNALTQPRIIAQAAEELNNSLKEILPEAASFEAVTREEKIIYYKAYDSRKNIIGAAFKASAKGYSSTIETLVGMLKNGQITAIKVIDQNETPGLGSQITDKGFCGQFSNKGISGLSDIHAITGATISSRAVIDSVKQKSQEIGELIKNE
ncbi:MAG: RnfABCDGE type electron transport complex subunit G [Candidatus Omnitrophota bacterium]|nr:RnfABCDGE type electron transport complex subunit G [Candidatus Omnitrophota bacterium]